MIFQTPTALWALSLLAIPIIIHLFQFKRYKQLLFPDVSLLKEVQSRSQTKNQIKHLLVLLSRLAFIAFIVLAFAQPFIPAKNQHVSKSQISIYVDNSFSMENAGENGSLLNEALQKAFEIAESYPSGTQFQLITNDLEPFQKRFTDFDAFIEALDRIKPSPQSANAQRLIDFHQSALSEVESESGMIYLISDFNQMLPPEIKADSNQELRIVKLQGNEVSNVSIDTVWLESPVIALGSQDELRFKITNRGNELKTDVPVELFIDNQLKSSLLLTIEPNESVDTSISISIDQSGYISGKLSIEDRPIEYDNNYYFELNVRSNLSVVEISGPNANSKPFEKLFISENQARYFKLDESNIILDSCSKADFMVLNEVETYSTGLLSLINNKLSLGDNVFIILPKTIASKQVEILASELGVQITGKDSTMKTAGEINLDDPIYRDIFADKPSNLNLPKSGMNWNLDQKSGFNSLMNFITGHSMLAAYSKEQGRLFVCTSPLSANGNTFAQHALFVPTMFNAALLSGSSNQLSYKVTEVKVNLPTSELTEQLNMKSNDSTSFIPTVAYDGLYVGGQITKDGEYRLFDSNAEIAKYAFNYDRNESDTKSLELEEIEAILAQNGINYNIINGDSKSLKSQISAADLGQELWVWAVVIALIFIIIESILIKLFNR